MRAFEYRAEVRAGLVGKIEASCDHISCATGLPTLIEEQFPARLAEDTQIAYVVSEVCESLEVYPFNVKPDPVTGENVQIISDNREYLSALETVLDNWSTKLSVVAEGIPERVDISVAEPARQSLEMGTLQATNRVMQDLATDITNLTNTYPGAPIEVEAPEILSYLTDLTSAITQLTQ